jgi:hypothetical protein
VSEGGGNTGEFSSSDGVGFMTATRVNKVELERLVWGLMCLIKGGTCSSGPRDHCTSTICVEGMMGGPSEWGTSKVGGSRNEVGR